MKMGEIMEIFKNIEQQVSKEKEEKKKKKYDELISYIANLREFSQLDIEDYAVEGGIADFVAKDIKERMKVNQLRKFFEGIKRVQADYKGENEEVLIDKTRLYKVLPELAYALGRKLVTQEYYKLVKVCIRTDDGKSKIKTVKDLNRFVDFLSAILAYHKMHSRS